MFKKMSKKTILSIILLSLIFTLTVSFLAVRALATREVTLTAYYPLPDGLCAADKVGIGTTSPGYKLDVNNTANCTAINKAMDKVLKLRGVIFEWKTKEYKNKRFPEGKHYGVIAQEIEKVLPELVTTNSKGEKYVAYSEIIPVLVEAIKDQQKQITEQQKQKRELKEQIEELKQRVDAMEKAVKVKKR